MSSVHRVEHKPRSKSSPRPLALPGVRSRVPQRCHLSSGKFQTRDVGTSRNFLKFSGSGPVCSKPRRRGKGRAQAPPRGRAHRREVGGARGSPVGWGRSPWGARLAVLRPNARKVEPQTRLQTSCFFPWSLLPWQGAFSSQGPSSFCGTEKPPEVWRKTEQAHCCQRRVRPGLLCSSWQSLKT